MTHLKQLEQESIHVIREVVAEFRNPVMLYSVGKDSAVMVRLAQKAFHPGRFPFPLMHVDTGYKFQEMYDFRDSFTASIGARLIVEGNTAAQQQGSHPTRIGNDKCCQLLKTRALLDGLAKHGFDAAFGGARRDEEKSRAKERFFSVRDEFGQWDPKNQRPELWNLYNGRHRPGEHIRVFPLSNWTELDIWQYIGQEDVAIPSIYYAHERQVFRRDGMLLAVSEFLSPGEGEEAFTATVRYRTVGDATITGAVESAAATVEAVIDEVAATRLTERGATRADDRVTEAAMEDRKKEGYF